MRKDHKKIYFASCPKGLESLLKRELDVFETQILETNLGGILFKASGKTIINFLLTTRTSSRVFQQIESYIIKDEKELYASALKKWWHQVFDLNQTFKIQTLFDREARNTFKSSLHFSQVLKDAIADQFREKTGQRPSVDTISPDIPILLRIEKTKRNDATFQALIYLDLCGTPLSERGYRTKGHIAPLRENLAAGILMSMDWDSKNEGLLDCMCGSGTFLIEAFLMKMNIAPTYLKIRHYIEKQYKPFSFQNHNWFQRDQELQDFFNHKAESIYNESLAALHPDEEVKIYGIDINDKNVEACKENLKFARIPKGLISVERGDATKVSPPVEKCIVLCNPPYGERMDVVDERLFSLYHDLGENFKRNFKGSRAYVFTGSTELRKKISLQTSARTPFYNGKIECRLLKYDLF